MKELKNLKRIAREELERLDQKYEGKSEFAAADAEMYKCLAMAYEKHLRFEEIENEMQDGEMMDGEGMMSGRRGRAMNGRFVSCDQGPMSYDDGYSGHYPYPPYPMTGYGVRGRNW